MISGYVHKRVIIENGKFKKGVSILRNAEDLLFLFAINFHQHLFH